jgi:stage III sporulation protein AB
MLWFKLARAACIIGGSGAIGLAKAASQHRRREGLRQMGLIMNALAQEILYRRTPLAEALAAAAQSGSREAAAFFTAWARLITVTSALTAAEAFAAARPFWPADWQEPEYRMLEAIARQIGSSSAAEQEKLFVYGEERRRQLEKTAQEDLERNSRLWAYGGFLAGSATVLLLL